MRLIERYNVLVDAVTRAAFHHYGERLVSLAVFGSVGRGTPRPDSDVDLLLVVRDMPAGRLRRVAEFAPIEADVQSALLALKAEGLNPSLSPVFKTPAEVAAGSPLFLDMLEDAKLLYDPSGFLADAFEQFRTRLLRLGARRIWRGNAWYWDLKPDYRPSEVFEL